MPRDFDFASPSMEPQLLPTFGWPCNVSVIFACDSVSVLHYTDTCASLISMRQSCLVGSRHQCEVWASCCQATISPNREVYQFRKIAACTWIRQLSRGPINRLLVNVVFKICFKGYVRLLNSPTGIKLMLKRDPYGMYASGDSGSYAGTGIGGLRLVIYSTDMSAC